MAKAGEEGPKQKGRQEPLCPWKIHAHLVHIFLVCSEITPHCCKKNRS